MRTLSWIILTLVTLLVMLASSGSAYISYFGSPENDVITGSVSLADLQIDENAATALRGRRGTAAAFALGFCVLLLFVILGPYRRGAAWAAWAILSSVGILSIVILLRFVALGTTQGTATGGFLLIVTLLSILVGWKKKEQPSKVEPPPKEESV